MNWTHTLRSRTQHDVEQAVQFFNEGKYYEAHEGFEKLWREAQGEERQFFQGLVQASVAFHFRSQHNMAGGLGMLDLATRNLAGYSGECHGLQLTALLCMLNGWRSVITEQSLEASPPRMEMHRSMIDAKAPDPRDFPPQKDSCSRSISGRAMSPETGSGTPQYGTRDIKLAVWWSRTPMSSTEATGFYRDLLDEKRVPLGEEAQVYAFYNELCTRYPENEMLSDEELEDSPWACTHERSGVHVIMAVNRERSAEVIPVVLELAQKHDLICFDPQTKNVFSPPTMRPLTARLTAW